MDMATAIAQTVRDLRQKAGLSQEKFADLLDSHQVYISEIESGKKTPSMRFLYKISQNTGLPFSSIIRQVEEKLDG